MTYDNSESSKRKCLRCGNNIPDDEELCQNCGTANPLIKTMPLSSQSVHAVFHTPTTSSDFDQFTPIVSISEAAQEKHRSPRDKLTTYKIWAPDNALWTEWAKPVLFAKSSSYKEDYVLDIPEIDWLTKAQPDTMIIIDLPGKTSVMESLALARLGFRPVPLYNGVNDNKYEMLVNAGHVADALYKGADELENMRIPNNAPPAFMLDSDRMNGGKAPGKYDNRWCIFPQDMPSASFLSKQGIKKVIVRSDIVRDDLLHILRRYYEQKIVILKSFDERVLEIHVPKPSWFKRILYRFKVIFGLARNAAGGFGGQIPEPGSGGG